MKIRDFQQQRLYDLEGDHHHYGRKAVVISLADAVELVRTIWQRWAISRPPTIHFRRPKRGRRGGSGGYGRINLTVKNETVALATVLHELGHCLAGADHGHGPKFAGIYLDLLDRYSDIDVAEMRARNRQLPRGKRVKIDRTWTLPSIRRRSKQDDMRWYGETRARRYAARAKKSAAMDVKVYGLAAPKPKREKRELDPMRPLTPTQVDVIESKVEEARIPGAGWDRHEQELLKEVENGFLGRRGFDANTSRKAILELAYFVEGDYGQRFRNTARRLYEIAQHMVRAARDPQLLPQAPARPATETGAMTTSSSDPDSCACLRCGTREEIEEKDAWNAFGYVPYYCAMCQQEMKDQGEWGEPQQTLQDNARRYRRLSKPAGSHRDNTGGVWTRGEWK